MDARTQQRTVRRITLLLALAVAWPADAADQKPLAPTFLRAPRVLSERDEIRVELRIVPHEAFRAVILEVWEADVTPSDIGRAADDDATGMETWELGALVRGSSEPVDETNGRQQVFRFTWRQTLPAGRYILVAKILIGRGITVERQHRLEVV